MPLGSPDDSQESFVWEKWDEMVDKNNRGSSQAAWNSTGEEGNRGGYKETLLQSRAALWVSSCSLFTKNWS